MKKIERGSVKHLILLVVLTIVVALIIYPLIDYIICKLFTKTVFIYTIKSHVVKPIIWGIFLALLTWINEYKNKVKSK